MSQITGNAAVAAHFEKTYHIVSHPRFLARQGLGNEVPFFIDPYDAGDEGAVASQIVTLHKRLANDGIPAVLLPMYEVVLAALKRRWPLERIFETEQRMQKHSGRRTFMSEMQNLTDPGKGKLLQTEIAERLAAVPDHRLVLMYQLGTVYPYLRTHTLLSNLHAVITAVPLVVFFPGEYVSSERDGYYFSLFNRFQSDYYRAFHLSEYIERGQIHGDVE